MEAKPNVTISVVGPLHSGKSTLCGRLLYDLGYIDETKIQENDEWCVKNAYSRKGKFAFVFDRTTAERWSGRSYAMGLRVINAEDRIITLVDTPSLNSSFKSAFRGKSIADYGMFVLDASTWEAQLRQLPILELISCLSQQIIVVVNKMQALDFDQGAYDSIVSSVRGRFAEEGLDDLIFIPVEAYEGENIVTRSANMPWYNGLTLIEIMNSLTLPECKDEAPLRVQIFNIFGAHHRGKKTKINGRNLILQGKVVSGVLSRYSHVKLQNLSTASGIESIHVNDVPVENAASNQIATIKLSDLATSQFIEAGEVITSLPLQEISSIRFHYFQLRRRNFKNNCYPIMWVGSSCTQVRVQEIYNDVVDEYGDPHQIRVAKMSEVSSFTIVVNPIKPIYAEIAGDKVNRFSSALLVENDKVIGFGEVIAIN